MHNLRILFVLAVSAGSVAAQDPDADLKKLSFMAGCWSGTDATSRFDEMWLKPSGGSMLGISRTVAKERTVFTEFMLIRIDAGKVTLHVQLRLAAKETPFQLTQVTDSEAVFSNPEHDFPQRIVYKAQPDGTLAARIEGTDKGVAKTVHFPMRAVACR